LPGSGPCRFLRPLGEDRPVENARKLFLGSSGVIAEIEKDPQVVQVGHRHDVVLDVLVVEADVFLLLVAQRRTGIADLVAVVEGLDGLLEPDGDEQTDDDRCNMDEEVFPRVRGLVRRVDVEHGLSSGTMRLSSDISESGCGARADSVSAWPYVSSDNGALPRVQAADS
jgi:hypothetical protein